MRLNNYGCFIINPLAVSNPFIFSYFITRPSRNRGSQFKTFVYAGSRQTCRMLGSWYPGSLFSPLDGSHTNLNLLEVWLKGITVCLFLMFLFQSIVIVYTSLRTVYKNLRTAHWPADTCTLPVNQNVTKSKEDLYVAHNCMAAADSVVVLF